MILSLATAEQSGFWEERAPLGRFRAVDELISIDEARRRVLEAVRRLEDEDVPLGDSHGRVLAEDVESAVDVPPFDGSAMDGYAVIAGPEAELAVVGESRAGHPAPERVEPGTAIRISTGAAMPAGATAVVPLERSRPDGGRVRVEPSAPGDNVRRAGEDVRTGSVVLARGALLGPAELGVAASVGRGSLRCSRRPRVAVLVTGDELSEPGRPLRPGGIYSSDGWALAAPAEPAGGAAPTTMSSRPSASSAWRSASGASASAPASPLGSASGTGGWPSGFPATPSP